MQLSRLILILMVILFAPCLPAEERTELHLFQYGRTNTAELMTAFLDFQDMLSEKLPNLSSELSSNLSITALASLKLKPVVNEQGELLKPDQRVGSLAEKQRYWQDTGALGVLTGHVVRQGEVPHVRTSFYWGELRGPFGKEMIKLELPVTGEYFDNTYDSHSVAIIYAFAHALEHDCDNLASTIYLLSEAHKRAQAVSVDSPDPGKMLETLVVDAIDSVKSSCGG